MSNEQTQARIVSGIKGLDEVLNGGFIRGGVYIIEGPPGTGKTILGNQLSFNQARAGNKVLYVTLIAETIGRMLQNIRNMSFFADAAIGDGIFYVSGFAALKSDGLTGLLHLLRREVTSHRAGVLIIDGFASAASSALTGQELKIFVQELQAQADAANCTVFLLTNPSEQKPSSEETMVEGIINLGTCLYEWRSSRELHVRKFRGSSYLQGVHAFQIEDSGIAVYPRLETIIGSSVRDNGKIERVSCGISRLDEMLGGGLPA
ncbi:MAG: RAD55 family ATPase, partial [Candidatus Binataceae bacterium]